MAQMMTQEEVLEDIRARTYAIGHNQLARDHGIHSANLSAILNGRRPLNDATAERLGYTPVFRYRKDAA